MSIIFVCTYIKLKIKTLIFDINYCLFYITIINFISGFDDAFHSLEKLNQYNFDLPADLAIRQLQNIKDAF